ncbi:MAG TPA: nicotinate (nicotinamide) nucleotide adenylyltransferase [Clostridia bacterium]|nr:nicotinate (nicotinamide) nucleotide adenylyltransferase [Clostridia bacterium]
MIGLFGGTFDPFHRAHRALAESAIRELALDQVIVMPVGRAPHKDRRTSFAAYRYEMARLGTMGLQKVTVSDDEIRSPGIDYTYDTVTRLKRKLHPEKLFVLAGSDVLESIDSWYRVADLLGEVTLAVAVRAAGDRALLESKALQTRQRYGSEVVFFEMPRLDISATSLRASMLAGDQVQGMCPTAVEAFIRQYRLYDFETDFSALSDDAWQDLLNLEEISWGYLSGARRLHSVSVAQYAARLARLNGLDVWSAAAGGLLHDMAKDLPVKIQRQLARLYLAQAGCDTAVDGFCEDVNLVHGLAAAHLAKDKADLSQDDLLEAIVYHSTARPGMTALEQILFLADKIAYDRSFDRLDDIRQTAEEGHLAVAMKRCLEEVFMALREDGITPHPLSVAAYEEYAHL